MYEFMVAAILALVVLLALVFYRYVTLKGNMQTEARKTFESWRLPIWLFLLII